ncbi:GxxExxY protein [Azospirillum canadense]|uniref:GxxExxY protein n=1 Tax=Azospirillum canadense TaxID=403962 RepID=UPI002227AF79|nr:GxxExxY protein [Azospirillum canadense]MCW2237765.1 GxxExxY protein [Azospirillum canadense]
MPTPISLEADRIAKTIVDAAFRVHSTLGPGLLESVYEACLEHELRKRGMTIRRQVTVPVVYDDIRIDEGFRIDLLVENQIVVEIKAAERALPVFEAQLLTYLKLTRLRLGFLINFNVAQIKDGLRRIAL